MEPQAPGLKPDGDELHRRRVEEVFQQVVELPPNERESHLEDLGDEPEVRAEVAMLLKLARSDLMRRNCMALCAGGRGLALSRRDAVVVHDTEGWKTVHELPGPAHAIASSPGGRFIALVKDDGIHVHETTNWEETARLTRSGFRPGDGELAIDADGQRLVALIYNVAVEIWDVAAKRCINDSLDPRDTTSVAISHDGLYAALGSRSGALSLWDLQELRELSRAGTHGRWLMSVAFSPDGRTLMTDSAEGTLRCWNVATGTEVLLLGDAASFWSCPISPDGRTFACGQPSKGSFRLTRLE